MINVDQLCRYVIKPALDRLEIHSVAREQMVLFTGVIESNLTHLDQVNRGEERPGPAYGLFQMEKATHDDLHANFISKKPLLAMRLQTLTIEGMAGHLQMHGNMYYAAAMCGIHYLRVKAPLPDQGDLEAMAKYWKRYYNTILGSGTEAEFIKRCRPILNERY